MQTDMVPRRDNTGAGGWLLSFWKSHELLRAAWVGDAGRVSLESDISKGSVVNLAVGPPQCEEAAFGTSPARRVFIPCGVSGEAGPDADRSGANPAAFGPSSWALSCLRVCLGRFALFQEMLVVGLAGFGLRSSPQGVAAGQGEAT